MKQFVEIVLAIFTIVSPICPQFVSWEPANITGRVLGIFPYPSKRHHIQGSTLLKALAKTYPGISVTMLSPYPLKIDRPLNYMDIPLPEVLAYKEELTKYDSQHDPWFNNVNFFLDRNDLNLINITLHSKGVRQLLDSPYQRFDVVIMECFMSEALLGIAYHFKAPVIFMTTSGPVPIYIYMANNPTPYAYIPCVGFEAEMGYKETVANTLSALYNSMWAYYVYPGTQNAIMQQVFPGIPHVKDLMENVTVVFLNSPHTYMLPESPFTVPIPGYHIPEPQELPEDLKTFFDSADNGVILFNLGLDIITANLPKQKLNAILATFRKLKQKVLFKYEEDDLERKPKNVKIAKWFPQNDILAHPKVKLFITHGGLLSTIEAVYHGVPIVGIPFYGDQITNVHLSAKEGFAVMINFHDLTESALYNAINEVIYDVEYTETIKYKSALIRNENVKPLDYASYLVRHVIISKGGESIRSAAQYKVWGHIPVSAQSILMMTVVGFLLLLLYLCCKYGTAFSAVFWIRIYYMLTGKPKRRSSPIMYDLPRVSLDEDIRLHQITEVNYYQVMQDGVPYDHIRRLGGAAPQDEAPQDAGRSGRGRGRRAR